MIETVEGRGVGAGKSYYVCTRIVSYLAEGGIVWASSSFGLVWDETAAYVADRYGVELERDQYSTFEQSEVYRLHEITPPGTDDKPVLLVIDEAHTALNARDWADKSKRPFFDWLTQSRHDNNDLIFISQAAANMDKQIARLVTYITRCRNMANFTFPGLGKWPFKQFVISRFDQDGRTLLKKQWISHDKRIFRCYRSKSCQGAHTRLAAALAPRKLKRVKRTKQSPMVKVLILLVVVGLCFGAYRYASYADSQAALATATPAPQPKISKQDQVNESPKRSYQTAVLQFFSDRRRPGHNGPPFMRTTEGVFILGHPTPHGIVVALECPDLAKAYAHATCNDGVKTTVIVAQHVAEPPTLTIQPTSAQR